MNSETNYPRDKEREWLLAYRNGDIEALGHLVDHFRRPLMGFIVRMVPNAADAEEVFQETWLRALRNWERFDDQKPISWLFRIAHNLVIDRVRRKRPEISMQQRDEYDVAVEDRLVAPGLAPAEHAVGRDLGRAIQAAVDQLPGEQKEVFLMRTEADLSFKEIAAIQGVSINTALGRMQYALSRLRQHLQPAYQELMGNEGIL